VLISVALSERAGCRVGVVDQVGLPMNYCGNVVSIQDAEAATAQDSITDLALKVWGLSL
jgi:hypothetical protein